MLHALSHKDGLTFTFKRTKCDTNMLTAAGRNTKSRLVSTKNYRVSICFENEYIPGQVAVLHGTVSDDAPSQFAPPCAGAGLLQSLSLVFIPPPQDLLHGSNEPHLLYPPFTKTVKRKQHSKLGNGRHRAIVNLR